MKTTASRRFDRGTCARRLEWVVLLAGAWVVILGGPARSAAPAGGGGVWQAHFPPAARDPAADAPWYRRCLVGMEVGPSGAWFYADPKDTFYCSRFDGRETVRRQIEAGSEYLVIWARDGLYAYYDSKIMPKCPGLGRRDVLREAVDEGARHGLPVIAYCVLQCGGVRGLTEEFKQVGADGKALNQLCFNSGYLDYVKGLITEISAYGVAGFHLDMPEINLAPPYGCWCRHCREQFLAEYGKPMPKGVTWDEDWERMLEFRYKTVARFEKQLADHVRKLNPEATVDFNYFGHPFHSWETGQRPVEHAHIGDFVSGEADLWGYGPLDYGLMAEFFAAAEPGGAFQVAMQAGVRFYCDQTTRPLDDMRWQMMTFLAHGAQVTMVDKRKYDGRLDPLTYERFGSLFHEARAKRRHFGQTPLEEVGIYYSGKVRDWYGRENPQTYEQAFLGAHKALAYAHIPCGVVLDENGSRERLKTFPVVLLPNVAIVSEKEVELLRRYVREGGNLIVTGLSGTLDRLGRPAAKFALAELSGAEVVSMLPSRDNYVKLPATLPAGLNALGADIRRDWAVLVEGPAVVLRATTAVAVGDLLRSHPSKDWMKLPGSADERAGPAVLVNSLGKGRVITLTCSPDQATASEHYVVEARLLLRNAVRLLNPRPLVEVSAPASVQAVITDEPAACTLRVHLLGYAAPPVCMPPKNKPYVLPALIEDRPMFPATITVRRPLKNICTWNQDTAVKQQADRVEVVVKDVHDIVILEY